MSAQIIHYPETSAEVFTLDNGLELVVREDRSAPVMSLQAWCRSGSIHEGERLGAGLSHFLEHMLFQGTTDRPGEEISRTVQAAGGYINAYTSLARTVYWIDVPSSGWTTCLDLLCEVVSQASLPGEEFAREQDVIRREFALGDDNPDSVIIKRLFATAFVEHPCRHPVIGHRELFDRLEREDLVRYYQEHYHPDNVFLVVVGDADPEAVRDRVEAALGGWERRHLARAGQVAEPRQLGLREDESAFPTDLVRLRQGWRIPGVTHEDLPALDVLASILGQGRSSRLFHRLREEEGLALSIHAHAYTPADEGLFVIGAHGEPENREALEAGIVEVLEEVKAGVVSEAEVDRAAHQTLAGVFETLNTMRGQASELGSNWQLTRNLGFTAGYVEAVQAVTREQVGDVARRYLVDRALSRVVLKPESEVASTPALVGKVASSEPRRVVLGNGLTCLLKRDARTPLVTTHATFRGGLLAESSADNGITRLMARLLVRDTQQRSAREVAETIEGVGGSISSSFGSNSFSVTVQNLRPDLDLGLDILKGALLEPAFLEAAVAREKTHQLGAIKAEADRPVTLAMRRLRRELFGKHPYSLSGSGTEASVSSLEGAQLEGLRQRLVAGQNGVLALVGDFDPDAAADRLAETFSALPSGELAFEERAAMPSPEGGDPITEGHDKEQAILLVGFPICDLGHEDQLALDLIDEACSDMSSRLFLRIREELGLAYSVGATRLLGLDPGCFIFYVATSPEGLEEAQEHLLDEIASLAASGLGADELGRAKSALLGKDTIHLQGPREFAGTVAVDELLGLGWDHHLRVPDRLKTVEADAVAEVAQRYFGSVSPTVVRLSRPLPEGGA